MKSRKAWGQDVTIGQTDIQLSSLVGENSLSGWFPLKPRQAGRVTTDLSVQLSGSIKLRVQWVHSEHALSLHIRNAIKE